MTACGVTYDVAPTDVQGTVKPEDVEALITPDTKAVVMTHASNVCGTIVPIYEIGKICQKHQLYFVVDTAQSAGTIDVNMTECNIDFLAFTGHKGLLGPQGIGGFILQEEMIEKWKDLFGVQPPQYGRVFMRKRLAHRIQELFYGGLPEMLKTQMLEQKKLQKRNAGIFKPGNRIIREWHGVAHEEIIRNNDIEYQGVICRSLTAVAKSIISRILIFEDRLEIEPKVD